MKLIIRLVLGIVAGILVGMFTPLPVIQAMVTFKGLFGELLNFTVPLVILFYVMSGIGSLQKGSGRILGVTVGMSYLSTIAAGLLAYFAAIKFLPYVIASKSAGITEGQYIQPWFSIDITPLLGVSSALVTAFIFGMGISITHSRELLKLTDHARAVIELVLLKVIIPGLPLYICSVFAEMAATGTVFKTISAFVWVLLLAVSLHWIWLLVLYTATGAGTGRNPLAMLRHMLPAYVTAVGTLSSAAAIPVTVDCARKLKLNNHVVDFTIPLCATIHLSGSITTLTVCSMAVMLMTTGRMPEIYAFLPFLITLGVAMVAAPGIPGGGVMASVGLLASILAFDDSAIALMIALYLAQDSFGTACNVAGDGAIAAIVDHIGSDRWEDS